MFCDKHNINLAVFIFLKTYVCKHKSKHKIQNIEPKPTQKNWPIVILVQSLLTETTPLFATRTLNSFNLKNQGLGLWILNKIMYFGHFVRVTQRTLRSFSGLLFTFIRWRKRQAADDKRWWDPSKDRNFWLATFSNRGFPVEFL